MHYMACTSNTRACSRASMGGFCTRSTCGDGRGGSASTSTSKSSGLNLEPKLVKSKTTGVKYDLRDDEDEYPVYAYRDIAHEERFYCRHDAWTAGDKHDGFG